MADRSPDRQSSTPPSRQRPDDGRSPPRLSVALGTEDGLGLESLGVSDGFAPRSSAGHDRSTASSISTHDPSSRPSARQSVSLNVPSDPPLQRSSIAKVSDQQGGRSPFALRNDALTHQALPRTPSTATASTVSNDTISAFRAQSPFQGPSRPTHPYAMYPQGTGIPSPVLSSPATSAVRLPERGYAGVGGPSHPYAMYPQSTGHEGGSASDSAPGLSIPVGFPGLGQNYQRRLGPEGEEAADIIGPDGHTEQLPPYSRYPDGVPPKGYIASTGGGDSPGSSEAGRDVPGNDPSRSQVSLNVPQSRLSVRSNMSDSSQARLNTGGTTASGSDRGLKEKLTEKGRRRVCWGKVPLWCLGIILATLILLLGGIIGGLLARHHARERLFGLHSQPQSTIFATVTTTLDGSPIATPPPYVPALPTGTWAVPVGLQESSNECLTNISEVSAWSCGPLSNLQNIQIEVKQNHSGSSGMVRLTQSASPQFLEYGAQPPVFNMLQGATMAMDIGDPGRGPAYFFHLAYDKIVVLPEKGLTSPNQSKRDISGGHERRYHDNAEPSDLHFGSPSVNNPYQTGYQGLSQKNTVRPGDLVWVCVWNNTLLEGFVYITQKSNSSLSTPSVTAGPSALPASQTEAPSFPYAIKIEERRIPSVPSQPEPYCQMMKVLDNGLLGTWVNATGDPVIETLHECKPWNSKNSRRGLDRPRLERRDDDNPACTCEWLSL
ncbi:hypothetical protein GP486_007465 [Trichoglossum hirsutum]|uniref:DUF7820 domain-containing protein n=1 Tax=Trichoglossum hirsutum TaxID=265104 RepID=A0A9P8L4U9_9PEZI|nr:hypothetical protein GP486_007465 [Trichoglossum hirsutum]